MDTKANDLTNKLGATSISWLNWTDVEWESWLAGKVDERKQVYLISPDDLVGSFNRERSHARDYHGRELLELIQNADDSGVGYSGESKLLIRLTDFGLLVANTGIPFSPEGVSSLMVSDNSPKQFLRTKCIGYKGLGFRSVLGWASSVVIMSGKLSVGFDEGFAANWLQGLRKDSLKVDAKIKQFEDRGINNPIATLTAPRPLHSGDDEFGDQNLKKLFDEAKGLQAQGYDTIVCLLFRNPEKTKSQVQQQINSLGNEILLFMQFIEKIDIETSEGSESWLVERKEKQIIVNPQSKEPKIWKIFSCEGAIPLEILRPEQILNNKYEIKIAIPEEPVEVNNLFVFFPTEVRFPFPLVAHATFEVGDNRQHLIDSDVNRFIAEKLAELLVTAAESIKDYRTPWYALSMVSPRADIDSVLEKFGFLGLLESKIKEHALLPVRNNHFEVVANAKLIEGNFDSLLTGEVFGDICIYADNPSVIKLLRKLGVRYIDYDDLRNRLNEVSDSMTTSMKVNLIYTLVSNELVQGVPPELLIDEQNNRISSGSSVFLPPEKKIFSLPAWVSQKVLNSEFASMLKDKFEVSTIRDLSLKLRCFNVQEYNMNSLVSSISAETNRRAKDTPENELELRRQMVQAIWSLYSSSSEKVKLREEITVVLPTRSGGFDSAKNLYLGKEYSNGHILEYLYAHIDTGLFISDIEKLGFPETTLEIEDFLCWLGVNNSPKHTELSFRNGDFLKHVISSLSYPAKFHDITIAKAEEIDSCYLALEKISCIDRFEEILETADPHAIICWVATCPEIELWRLNGDINAIFQIKQPRQWDYRKLYGQHLPSYILWLLRNVAWLPISGGQKIAPSKCSLARGAKDLEPSIGYPAIDMAHPLIKALNLDVTAIKNALFKIGVVTDLNELSWDSFYEVLLELPKLDPEGNKAKSLYRILLGRSDLDIAPYGEKYDSFISKGKMLGRERGKASYYPISELFYVDNITLPSNITEEFPLLELDKRRGAAKVKKLFGVEQLTRDSVKIEIAHFEEHNASQNFQSDFDRLKPYIYAVRVEEDTNRVNLSSLKRLKVKLCKSVRVTIEINGEKREIELGEGDSVNIDTVAYLVSEPSDYNRSFLHDEIIADALGEIVANILKVDVNNEIARLASCVSEKRDLLLNRIVGGSGKERMEKARELLKEPEKKEDEEVFKKPSPWVPPPKIDEKSDAGAPKDESVAEEPKPSDVGTVSVEDVGKIPILQGKKIVARRIQGNPKNSNVAHNKKRVNPDRAENIALRFEESQERYAIKVSHIRGFEAYGCDILSFKSEKEFILFKEKSNPDVVERFIEVKGSVNEKGSISLGGNELRSAQTYREKFFLYRIYEDEESGLFELIALGDPLNVEKEAFEISYEINPFRSNKSHVWKVEENTA